MPKILDVYKRYHATNDEALKQILKDRALKTRMVMDRVYDERGEMPLRNTAGGFVYEEQLRPVFTSTGRRDWVNPGGKLIEIEIPGDRYVQMKRAEFNPDYPPATQYKGLGNPWKVFSVDHGGTADFFAEDIPMDYFKRICLDGTRKCYDVDKILEMYGIEK